MLSMLLFLFLGRLDSCFDRSLRILDTLKLLLELLTFFQTLGLFLSLLLLLAEPFTLCKALEPLLFLELQVEGRTELVSVIDSQCVFQLLHVLLFG